MSYDRFRQRVRRHRRTDVLLAVARLNASIERDHGDSPEGMPNVVQPFILSGVARTAIASANEFRNSAVTNTDLVEMCAYYANVDDPVLEDTLGIERMRYMLNHLAYEQFESQYSPMENVGRTLILLSDCAAGCPSAPSPGKWESGLGAPLEGFIRLGFAMFTAAVKNNGQIERDTLLADHVAPIFSPLTAPEAVDILERWFARDLNELGGAALAEEAPGIEKWAFNPLIASPIVALPDDRFVVPWPRLLLDRISPSGLYFIGLELFGDRFPDTLGCMFEEYVGRQLALLEHADVYPEIVYGKPQRKTVDYFVVLAEVVLLIEVKAARPIRATGLGEPAGDDDTVKKIGKAFAQIETTTGLVQRGHPALAGIPKDRPLRGVVVTLEPFHLVNSVFYADLLSRPSIPTAVVSSHELEVFVGKIRRFPDIGERVVNALTPKGESGSISLASAADDIAYQRNSLLDDAWERFSKPWSDAVSSKQDDQ